MHANIRWIQACLVAMTISGCALQPVIRPVTDPTTRIRGKGFSVLPPQGKDWYIAHQAPNGVNFGKISPDKLKYMMDKHHFLVAGVFVTDPPAKKGNSPAEFLKAIEHLPITEGRFRLISMKTSPFGPQGSYCAQYDRVLEERDNPLAPGVVLELTEHGFYCLDASSKFVINAAYSERKPQGIESFLDDALKQEAEGFLRDVVVTPLR